MLDVTNANMLRLTAGMGASRNEQLAEYFLRAAGIAAVWIDEEGHIGAQDVAPLTVDDGRAAFCCPRGSHFVLAYRLCEWKKGTDADRFKLALKLEELAEQGGVGLTPHEIAVGRALNAVATVNRAIETMKASGQLADFNRDFKAARKVDRTLRFHDYLHARKAAMLEAIAMGKEIGK